MKRSIPSLASISVTNFFSVRDTVSYELENQGLVVVNGRNGQGKTSLFLEAIDWLLYATSLEYGEKPGGAVRNRHGKGDAVVTGIIKTHTDTWKVTRKRSKSEGSMELKRQLPDGGWEDAEQTTMTLTQKKLEDIWGRDRQTFLNSCMFTSDLLRYPDLPDEQKKAIIDRLLNVGSLRDSYSRVTEKISELSEQLGFAVGGLNVHNTTITKLESKIRQEQALSDDFEEEHSGKRERTIKRRKAVKKQLEETEDVSDADLEQVKEYVARRDKVTGKKKEAERLNLEWQLKAESLKSSLKHKSSDLKTKKDLVDGGNCPTCGADASHLCDEVTSLQAELEKLTKSHNAAVFAKTSIETTCTKLSTKLRQLNTTIDDLNSAIEEKRRARKRLLAELETLNTEVEDATNPHTQTLESLNTRMAEEKASRITKQEEEKTLQAQLDDLAVIKEAFGNRGLRTLLLDQALPFLEDRVTGKLTQLGSGIKVGLEISDAGKLLIRVDNPDGAGQYHGNSKGERRLIDLALLFSFFEFYAEQNGGYPPQIVFDEAFESVDAVWQEQLGKLLREIVDRGVSVFFLSHASTRLEGIADQVWTISNGRLTQA